MATTSSNSHSHPVKVGGKSYATGSIGHQHTVPDQFTDAEVKALKALLAVGDAGGGTTPIPNDPPPPTPDTTAPTVSGVTISAITTTSATISWTTSEAATGVVDYGTEPTEPYQYVTSATSSGTTHSRTLTGLTPNLRYYFRVRATDTAGNTRTDSARSFTTLALPVPPGPEPPGSSVTVSNAAQLRAAIDNLSISTVVLNPGTYQPGSDIAADYFLPPAARPSSNPLLIRALNIPAVATDPFDVIWKSRMYFRNRRGSYTTWQGISFEDINVGTTGVVVFGAYGEPGPDHVSFQTVRFVDNVPLNASNSHHWYLSSGSSSYITIDDWFAEGVDRTSFTGFHAYHEDLGNHITVKNGVVRKVYAGLLMYGTAAASPPKLTDFLGEDIDIQDARTGVDIRYVQGVLRRVSQANVGPGTSYIKGPITLDDCPTLPAVTP